MEYVNLGSTGLKVSRICLGMMSYGSPEWRPWVLPEQEARPFIQRALEAGINFFDTADMYSRGESERILGRALKDMAERDKVVVATKVYFPMGDGPNDSGLSRYHILNSIDQSLERLGMDHVDLYQIHRWDPTTPIEETLSALDEIVRSGRARYIGASSMFAWQFAKALAASNRNGWARFVSMQNHYNLVYREEEREMLPLCRDQGIGVIPWSPLARGFLAGNRQRGGGGETSRAHSDSFADQMYFKETDFDIVEAAQKVAEARGVTSAQVALAWLLQQPAVTAPIIGATKLDHLNQAIEAVDIKLSDEEIESLEAPYSAKQVMGHS